MNGVEDAPTLGLSAPHQRQLLEGEHKRLLAQHMDPSAESQVGNGCVSPRRSADVKEIRALSRDERLHLGIESGPRKMRSMRREA
jgi:hypothetical protein